MPNLEDEYNCYDWPSSEVLFYYLQENDLIGGSIFVDFSAGTGKLGCRLLKSEAKLVYFTERSEEVLRMTKRNVLKSLEGDKQKWERCRFKVFDWYDFQLLKTSNVKQFLNNEENESVFVLLSDCFYDRKHFEQLVCTLSFWNSCKMTKVYVCQEIRCPDWSIDCELELWNLFPERIIYSSSDDGKIFCTFIINKIIVQ